MQIEKDSELIQEALVRRMRDAQRWQGVLEAWEALLKVQLTAKSLMEEREHFSKVYTEAFRGDTNKEE